jgi:hypothetical protein
MPTGDSPSTLAPPTVTKTINHSASTRSASLPVFGQLIASSPLATMPVMEVVISFQFKMEGLAFETEEK